MRVAVVIPCYRQERWLHRTIGALEHALAASEWEGVLVRAAAGDSLASLSPRWTVIAPPTRRPLTPGAARMLGLSATRAPWVLFCDADVEVSGSWMAAALERAGGGGVGGIGGRLEEWFETRQGERPGLRDMYRVGESERDVPYLATLVLYSRDALLKAGGYDPRLTSEEDYELGMRLRRIGQRLVSLGERAGRHFSEPRPSMGEVARRWHTGLCFGQGQVLRLYMGRRGLGELVKRQRIYFFVLAYWAFGFAAALASPGNRAPLLTWAALGLLGTFLLVLRKHSVRLALFSVLTWHVNAAGMVRGFIAGPLRAGPRPAESAP